ncbi:hypothetical protein BDDG_01363 [Blastomyces dermatitidis ATCC 18188]|uniref:Uncharacterized protein n=1 Tax=Ajellomyces dermatitidis (strain ATCC 18188 / CBS 674.68) TaxID=653446 RepID=F2T4J8_AJEDA|nr:hypothetical protein BDDG_01363 [Blastomyces dermatitidis ATCC 18188]
MPKTAYVHMIDEACLIHVWSVYAVENTCASRHGYQPAAHGGAPVPSHSPQAPQAGCAEMTSHGGQMSDLNESPDALFQPSPSYPPTHTALSTLSKEVHHTLSAHEVSLS